MSYQPPTYTKFANELWDGFEAVGERAKLEIKFLRDFHSYFQKRLKVEQDYSKALSTLSAKNQYANPGGSMETAWEAVLAHTQHEASLHGTIAASFAEKLVDPVASMIKDMDKARTRLVGEGQFAIKEYQKAVATLHEVRAKYEKAGRDAVSARKDLQTNTKVQERVKLEQAVMKAEAAHQEADADYRRLVIETNAAQDSFFNSKLPKVQSEFEHSMFVRIHMVKVKLGQFVSLLEQVPPQDVRALAALMKNVELVNNEADIEAFVAQHRSGETPPPPFVYEVFDPDDEKKKGKGLFRKSLALGMIKSSSKEVKKPDGRPVDVVSSRPNAHVFSAASGAAMAANDASAPAVYTAFRPPPEPVGLVFGRSMDDLMADQTDLPTAIPIFIQRVVEAIYELDGPSLEGIFRIPPNMDELNALKAKLDAEGPRYVDIVGSSTDAYTPCALLKAFLRELPTPLIPVQYYEICTKEPNRCIEVVNALPELSRTVVVYLANFLQDLGNRDIVAHTMMNLENLSMVFAPSLLRCPYTDPIEILNAAKPEGVFSLRLLQMLPSRDQLSAEGNYDQSQQPASYGQHSSMNAHQEQLPAYGGQGYYQQDYAYSGYSQAPPVVHQSGDESPESNYAPLSRWVEGGAVERAYGKVPGQG